MTYCIGKDGTVQVLSSPDTAMCQGRIMSNNDGSFHSISKAQLGKLFDND